MSIVDPQPKTWNRDEYYRAAAAGVFVDQRVELVAGEILTMSPMNAAHAAAIQLVTSAFYRLLGDTYSIRIQTAACSQLRV